MTSAGSDEAFFADLKEFHATEKAELGKSLAASEKKPVDAERGVQEFEHNKNTLDDLATAVDEARTLLKSFKEQGHFLENKLFEQINQLVEKNASSSGYQERFAVLEKDLVTASAEVEGLPTGLAVDKDLCDGFRTAFALHKTATQQCVSANDNHLRSYWLMWKLSTPNSVTFRRICKPRLIESERLWRAR